MTIEAWVALASLALLVVGALLIFERRLSTAIADIAWLKAYAMNRRHEHEQGLG